MRKSPSRELALVPYAAPSRPSSSQQPVQVQAIVPYQAPEVTDPNHAILTYAQECAAWTQQAMRDQRDRHRRAVEQLEHELAQARHEADLLRVQTAALGIVQRFLTAADTLLCWEQLIENTQPRQFIHIVCYTFDLDTLKDHLLEAKRRQVTVEIVADRMQSYGNCTRSQHNVLQRLEQAGVSLYTRSGARGGLAGICHAKMIYNNEFVVLGSCNFTRNSQNNFEINADIKIQNLQEVHNIFQRAKTAAQPFVRGAVHRDGATQP